MVKASLQIVTMPIPSQKIITEDNVSIDVAAVAYFKVVDPYKAVVEVENYSRAVNQISQTTVRSVVGQFNLDEILSETPKINLKIQGNYRQTQRTMGNKCYNSRNKGY